MNPPTAFTYGRPLSAVQVNATANVAGSFSYIPPSGTVFPAGTHTLRAAFTPENPSAHNNAETTVSLIVLKAQQTVTFDLPPFALLQQTFLLNGQASSSLPIFYSASGPGNIQAGVISFSNVGQVTVTASQDGNENYLAATPVVKSVMIIDAAQTNLKIEIAQGSRIITWPDDGGLLILETTAALGSSASWTTAPGTVETINGQRRHVVQPGGQTQFYRLRAPQ